MEIHQQPAVITWFKVYSGVMVLLNLFVFLVGILFMATPETFVNPNSSWYDDSPSDEFEAIFTGFIYAGFGFVLMIGHAIALFLGRQKWVWMYNLVIICIGLTSCCCVPTNIPLLLFWLKKECKDWYGA